MKITLKNLLPVLLLSFTLIISCSDESEDQNDPEQESIVGAIEVSGDESFSYDSPVVITSRQEVTSNGITYNYLVANILGSTNSSNQTSVNIGFLVPTSEGSIPSDGSIEVLDQQAGLNEAYATVTITGTDIYTSNTATTGQMEIFNSSPADGTFEVAMELQNITSFNDGSVNLTGNFVFE